MSTATNFFERQDDARRNTSWLVALFAVAVVLVILALSVPLFLNGRVQEGLLVGGVVGAVVLLASGYRLLQLRGGGRVVAEGLGGRLLPASTRDPAERRLLNVVEEMALASGVPAPPVYVMDDEMQINAFAAGLRPEDAVLGFTEGCMRRLPRDELQGVVAHEFSHIKHGDMRLNIRLMGLIFGLMALVYLGWTIIRIGFHSAAMARKKEDAGGLALVLPGLALVVVGGLGAFFGSLLKAMVSRQREYLADASAVQYTRNPAGIANALRRLGDLGSSVKHKNAAESSHMFFGRGVSSLFATHPPIQKRVKAIDPGGQWTSGKLPPEPEIQLESRGVQSVPGTGAAGFVGHAAVAAAQATTVRVQDAVGDAADDLLGAVASVFAVLALEDEDPPDVPLRGLADRGLQHIAEEASRLLPRISRLRVDDRLPFLEHALPVMAGLSESQYHRIREAILAMIQRDGGVTLLEAATGRMLIGRLDRRFRGHADPKRNRTSAQLRGPINVLLRGLAEAGHPGDPAAQSSLSQEQSVRLGFGFEVNGPAPRVRELDEALARVARLEPEAAARLGELAVLFVEADGQVRAEERELLALVGSALDLSFKPALDSGAG
ncbi:MAG: hypothetical protein CMJ30_05745 [Phycisphaerae bacterium]|jgi:Zn-dependent protease with chaperone function|nr:hypothetical protein [Phycisphaerae bacterium]